MCTVSTASVNLCGYFNDTGCFFFVWLIEMRMNKKKIKHTTEFTLKIGIKTVKFDRYMQIEHKNYNNNNNQLHGQ